MKHPSSKFTVHLTPTFANEVKSGGRGCAGLPPAKYIEAGRRGFLRMSLSGVSRAWEGGKEVKGDATESEPTSAGESPTIPDPPHEAIPRGLVFRGCRDLRAWVYLVV